MKDHLRRSNETTRRQFVARTARTLLGVSVLPTLFRGQALVAADAASPLKATAKNVIYLFMAGGQSHIDTWDPKEGVEAAASTKTIKTSADGVLLGHYLPRTAGQMHHATLIRSLTSTQGAHEQGDYFMHTSYTLRGTVRHPSLGAWMNEFQGADGHKTLPNFVYIGNGSRHPGAGFLPAAQGPLFVNNPANGIKNAVRQEGLPENRFAARLDLAGELDAEFRATFPHRNVKAYAEMYDHAITMMKSEDLKAFDLTQESADMRKTYGDEAFGQGCLLARRLVERGVRFVEVSLGGWDTHASHFVRMPLLCSPFDRALAALLGDLHTRGLLRETLVVVATEFGRTPDVNANVGRDHHPKAFSALLAGGGVKGGFVHGQTDKEAREIVDGDVTIPDFNATIAHALGLPLDRVVFSPSKRPFTVADKGKPVLEVFA